MAREERQGEASADRRTRDLDHYLESPTDTLLESLEDEFVERVSPYDLIQAYSLFSARIKKLSDVLRNDAKHATAVRYIKENASGVSKALARDIRRVITALRPDLENDNNEEPPTVVMSEEDVQQARSNSALAQHALVLTAEVFCMPELSSSFNDEDAAKVLHSILSVLNASTIPTPGEKKTRCLALWTLSLFRIPLIVFERQGPNLLESIASITADRDENEIIVGDALKVLHNLLVQHPLSCLPLSIDLLAHVLRHLISPIIYLRTRAAHALIGFARALLAHKAAVSENGIPVRDILSTRIAEFVEEQVSLHRRARNLQPTNPHAVAQTLIGLVHAEIPQDSESRPGPQVGWAYAVLNALVVLSDGQMFTRPSFLKFVGNTAHNSLNNDWAPLHALHAGVWRAFVWAFTRVAYLDDSEEAQWERPSPLNGRSLHEVVFGVVKQLPNSRVGSTLIYALLGPAEVPAEADTSAFGEYHDEEDVPRAITVIGELICSKHRRQRVEGVTILTILSGSSHDPDSSQPAEPVVWDPRQILSETMFDLALVDADHERVKQLTQAMKEFLPGMVRPLSDEELVKYWDRIVDIWDESMREAMQIGNRRALEVEGRLMRIWQGLLRAQQNLTQSQDCEKLSARIAKIVVAYLDWKPCCPRCENPFSGCITSTRLKAIRQLILSSKKSLSPEVMKLVACKVFAEILQADIKLDAKEVKTLWIEVCSELCVAGGMDCFVARPQDADFKVKRKRWNMVADTWVVSGTPHTWAGAVAFLAVPFTNWTMIGAESDRWIDLFEYAVSSAKNSVGPNKVLDMLCSYIRDPSPPFTSKIMLTLVPNLSLKDTDTVPTNFLTRINSYLNIYPPSRDDVYHCQEIIRMIGDKFLRCSRKHVVPVLMQLKDGLGVWLHDKYNLAQSNHYDDIIITFYCNAVSALRSVPLRVDDLRSLDTFLTAPFSRPKPNEQALHALHTYWEKIEGPWQQLMGNTAPPSGVEKWMSMYHYAYECKRPFFLNDSSSSSQSEVSMTTVPDSQPPLEDEVAGNRQEESRTPIACDHPTPTPLTLLNERVSHTMHVAAQASISTSPEIRSPKTPTALSVSRHNHHGPLNTSPLHNSVKPASTLQSVTGPSVLGKRRTTQSELTSPRQRRRTATARTSLIMSETHMAPESEAVRVRGGRDSPDSPEDATQPKASQSNFRTSTLVVMAEANECQDSEHPHAGDGSIDAKHGLPSPPSSFDEQHVARRGSDSSDKENAPLKTITVDDEEQREHIVIVLDQPAEDEPRSPLSDAEFFVESVEDEDKVGHGDGFAADADYNDPLQAVQLANELLRLNPDMPIDDVLAACVLVNQMDGMLQERIRSRLTGGPSRSL